VRDFIERIENELPGTVVVADMEAGLEHLSWAGGTLRYVDLLLVVVQPTAKVMMTADRTHKLALELGIPRIAFVGNRALGPADVERMEAFAAERDCELLIAIPEDGAVPAADRAAGCVLDTAPGSDAVGAIGRLASLLEGRFLVGASGP
jgi:CO dehydrogenase maturation factor